MSLNIINIAPAFKDVMPDEYIELVEKGPYGKEYGLKKLGTFKEVIEEHPLCAGCGLALAQRLVLASLPNPEDTVIVGTTGCSSLSFSQVAIQNLHVIYGNQNAVASGLKRALQLRYPNKEKDVVVIAGDGGTCDIGLDMVLHSWFRQEKITTIMLDNEVYANTGGQESGMSPEKAVLNMAPLGKKFKKVDLPNIAINSGCVYVASLTVAKPMKIARAVKKAVILAREVGPTYIQIYTPCVTNFKLKSSDTIKVAKQREKDGTYPIIEFISDEAKEYLKKMEAKNGKK